MADTTNANPKILVIMTGGTICCSTDAKGKRYSNVSGVKIIDTFKNGKSKFCNLVDFDKDMPMDTLSENMTVENWNQLLNTLRKVDYNNYKGIIILHGTDTLAFTASLLSILLAGIKIPVCLVSSQLPLDYSETNGNANFRASVELIMNNIAPNVYAVYRNSNGIIYTHFGSQLLQCENYSEDFYSRDAMEIKDPNNAALEGKAFETSDILINKIPSLTPCVLKIVPFVGIDYNAYNLNGIRAVVHGTYHSETVCVERKNGRGDYSNYSILSLMDRCKANNIPLFLAPCSPQAYKYESTGDILANGASHICGMTNEMAYIKTLVGCALKLDNEALKEFVNKSINYEIIYS